MAQQKRAWKLQEFVAHGANVQCLGLGHKSSRVMVTGGEDRKVNLWAVGKPHCIMTLTGHTTTVEAVRFGNAEEMVVAGSQSGALKVWDLEQAKIMRTLTGHTAGIRALDFHPFAEFVGSGSMDSHIKLWDIRRKGCIKTYKGHLSGVNSLRFSPDGKWIASAGEDGIIKLWDLAAGKLVADLKLHQGPVNVVEFHPNEVLLVSASSDRTVKFWDLETLKLISSSPKESKPVCAMWFHPEGKCVYAGADDSLKVYGWEPYECYDSVPLNWGDVADIAFRQDQLIGASYSKTNVAVHVVDISRVRPMGVNIEPDVRPTFSRSGRRSFMSERPSTQSTPQARMSEEDAEEQTSVTSDNTTEDNQSSSADIQNQDDYAALFRPRSRLARSPTRVTEPFQQPLDDDLEKVPVKQNAQNDTKVIPDRGRAVSRDRPSPRDVSNDVEDPQHQLTPEEKYAQLQTQDERKRQSYTEKLKVADKQKQVDKQRQAVEKQKSLDKQKEFDRQLEEKRRKEHEDRQRIIDQKRKEKLEQEKAERKSPPRKTLAAEDFLPQHAISDHNAPANMSEDDSFASIEKGHTAMLTVMSSRSRNLQIVRAMWTSGNTKTAVDSAISMNDPAVMVDILNVLNFKPTLWSLDLCNILLPQLKELLNSKYECYVLTTCTSLKLILKNMGSVIKANIQNAPSIGVDISREERHRKCNECYGTLMAVRTIVEKRQSSPGKLGNMYKQIQILMGTLD